MDTNDDGARVGRFFIISGPAGEGHGFTVGSGKSGGIQMGGGFIHDRALAQQQTGCCEQVEAEHGVEPAGEPGIRLGIDEADDHAAIDRLLFLSAIGIGNRLSFAEAACLDPRSVQFQRIDDP